MIQRCRNLRKNGTEAEDELWQMIRNRKINQLKFNRQFPLIYEMNNGKPSYFIADFYCSEKKVVIELDGKIHEHQREYDENRDQIISSLNIKVIRFKNNEIEKAINYIQSL